MVTNICFLIVVQDILYTIVLAEVNLTGKAIKAGLDILIFICLINLFYVPRVKKFKKILTNLTSREEPKMTKWEEV